MISNWISSILVPERWKTLVTSLALNKLLEHFYKPKTHNVQHLSNEKIKHLRESSSLLLDSSPDDWVYFER